MPQAKTSDLTIMTSDQRASDALLRQFVGYRMKRAYLLIQDDIAETLAPFGLRTGTFSALGVVIASPGISQNDLSEVLNIKRSGVVVVVDELESAGVLKRKRVKGDRRTNALTVTAAGKRLWEKVEKAVQDHEAALFSDLTPQEISQLRKLLGRVSRGTGIDLEQRQ
ncbi:MarR family winged helix-turn-helix transcriptional regulator [Rhodalgimonas zhirmunskyi]|uniref:MarR family winged helix-turn-helix transcriptional regulator n=1 Tax=Rhodalgimonas zhirmunskyi TaxID=2964767 RepID=A0AAJ1U5C6_9RHOB|nr:MarR family winged helix-turn-helix transcriptional regulator [Rhodoalgimonas zhirmunskyi]MDQ2093329.1 MarR family winged helix-turn-helix transcriptional regulator [Rhodoalgimonas zhirmunskyi]